MKYHLLFILLIFFTVKTFSFEQSGVASWYGPRFHGEKTANGEIFNTYDFTAAHKTLPFNSIVKIISLINNKEAIVRINDRGPFAKGRVIDLSMAAAKQLGLIKHGTMKVKIILLEKGNNSYHRYTQHKYSIQVASFSMEDKADDLQKKLLSKGLKSVVRKNKTDKNYYRIIIDDLNYSELQLYRVKLHNEGINNYLVIKKI